MTYPQKRLSEVISVLSRHVCTTIYQRGFTACIAKWSESLDSSRALGRSKRVATKQARAKCRAVHHSAIKHCQIQNSWTGTIPRKHTPMNAKVCALVQCWQQRDPASMILTKGKEKIHPSCTLNDRNVWQATLRHSGTRTDCSQTRF